MAKTTQDNRDRNESRNIRVVSDFLNHWDSKSVDLRNENGGLFFKAQVTYSSPKNSTVEETNVRISQSGYDTDGAIDIFEEGDLTTDDYHLGIVAAFGAYSLDAATGQLVYDNTSAKMGGKFTVGILPI